MTYQEIKKLDSLINSIQENTVKVLESYPSLFDSRARNEQERGFFISLAANCPDILGEAEFVRTLTYPDSTDNRYDLSFMAKLVRELSDRYVTLKVLVNDLVPLLTDSNFFDYNTTAPYFPYLAVLLDQIENNASDLSVWYDENFERLRDRFEYSLKENEDFQIIRSFIDRILAVYAEKHNAETVQHFQSFALKALDQYADGDDDVSFAFSFDAGDEASTGVSFSIDNGIEISMSDYVRGPCGGDTEQLWAFSLSGNGESIGYNGLREWKASDIGGWKLSIENPDEFYYEEED